MNHDVFISFSFADRKTAEDIVNTLTSKYGISCWICTRNLYGGDLYKHLIPEAIDACRAVVFIQSSDAVASKEIPKEIGIAFDAEKTIIPFRIDDSKLTGKLRYDLYGVEYIDATVPTMEERIDDLANSISKAIGKPLLTESAHSMTSVLKSTKISCHEIFAGRDKLIETIHKDFQQRDIIFLCGMGGIGKSQLACQYWKKYRDFYTTVVFGRYESSLLELIADDTVFKVEGVTRKTKADNSLQTDEEYAVDKLSVIKKSADQHTLIIIDNFDAAGDPFFDEFVRDADYRVLITGRCEPQRDKYHVIPVEEIDDDTLKEIFIQYANPNKTIIEKDDPDFKQLFEMTNRHTYTLELLAKYMEENDDIDEIGELIEQLKNNSFAAISKDGYDTIRNLFRLTSLSEKEKTFMRCLAMMPQTGVPQKLFKQWAGDVFSARSRLVDLGLVKINGDTRSIELHPIIKEVVITELNPAYENCKDFINRCTLVGEDRIPKLWSLTYEQKQVYIDCYLNIINMIGDITKETYDIFVNVSILSNFSGDCESAVALHRKIYEFACRNFGEASTEAMLVLNRIGWKYSNTMNYESACRYLVRAADWFIENPDYHSGYISREAYSSIENCAGVYYYLYLQSHSEEYKNKVHYYLEKLDEYGDRLFDALKNESEELGSSIQYQHALIHRSYFRLYLESKQYDKAEIELEKYKNLVYRYMEYKKYTEFADLAGLNESIGMYKYERQQYDEAITAFEESYRVYRKFFSERNARIIRVIEYLIQCYIKVGSKSTAMKYIDIISETVKSIYTKEHPIFARINEYRKMLD